MTPTTKYKNLEEYADKLTWYPLESDWLENASPIGLLFREVEGEHQQAYIQEYIEKLERENEKLKTSNTKLFLEKAVLQTSVIFEADLKLLVEESDELRRKNTGLRNQLLEAKAEIGVLQNNLQETKDYYFDVIDGHHQAAVAWNQQIESLKTQLAEAKAEIGSMDAVIKSLRGS